MAQRDQGTTTIDELAEVGASLIEDLASVFETIPGGSVTTTLRESGVTPESMRSSANLVRHAPMLARTAAPILQRRWEETGLKKLSDLLHKRGILHNIAPPEHAGGRGGGRS